MLQNVSTIQAWLPQLVSAPCSWAWAPEFEPQLPHFVFVFWNYILLLNVSEFFFQPASLTHELEAGLSEAIRRRSSDTALERYRQDQCVACLVHLFINVMWHFRSPRLVHPPFEEAIYTTKGPRSHAVGHPQPNQLGAHDRLRRPIPATPGLIETNDFFPPVFGGIFHVKTSTLCYIL